MECILKGVASSRKYWRKPVTENRDHQDPSIALHENDLTTYLPGDIRRIENRDGDVELGRGEVEISLESSKHSITDV